MLSENAFLFKFVFFLGNKGTILFFCRSHNTSCLPTKILHNGWIRFLLGHEDDPREIENNAYANFWGVKRGLLWDLQK